MAGTRIRPDKQIQTAPGQGYVLQSDINGELQFALLSALIGNGNQQDAFGDIRSIDSLQLLGNTLVLRYTNNQGVQMVKSCDLTSLAVDVKVTGAFLQRLEANTYILQITQSDGTTTSVNLSELLAIVTVNSADIIFSGNGTASSPLTAVLSDSAKTQLSGAKHWTDEFTALSGGNSVQLTYTPIYPFPLHPHRNGLRQKELTEWKQDPLNPRRLNFQINFGANGQYETVVVDYMTLDPVGPRQLTD
ncbi:MAG: hypothetical protein JST27_05715 [Bacteroidetes bacterium]|nr:hypothetical protein [Bacteroidota bacterium]